MFDVKKVGKDVLVAMEEKEGMEKGAKEELGLPDDLEMSQEEWDRLEEQMEEDAISWWV